MNIRDANDINQLLNYLLRRPTGSAPYARDAAVRLANHAYATLHAGLDGDDVALAWRDLEDLVADEAEEQIEAAVTRTLDQQARYDAALEDRAPTVMVTREGSTPAEDPT
jgi:hypothetical protein